MECSHRDPAHRKGQNVLLNHRLQKLCLAESETEAINYSQRWIEVRLENKPILA